MGKQHIDIWIESKKIAIEYQGEQHSRPIEYFGGEQAYLTQVKRDLRKKEILENNGIKLIYIYKGYNLNILIDDIKKHKKPNHNGTREP